MDSLTVRVGETVSFTAGVLPAEADQTITAVMADQTVAAVSVK